MLNSYNPYNVISLDMSSKDKSTDKAYIGTRIFPVSFFTTTDEGNVVPYPYEGRLNYPLESQLIASQNYDYSEAQLENETPTRTAQIETTTSRTGSFLVVPWLLTYCGEMGIFNSYSEDNPADVEVEIQNIVNYINENNLTINNNIGDFWNEDGNQSGFVIGITADGTLHPLALDLQFNSDNSAE